jgi:sugar transferase (PEP-CTERM system associated)
MIYLFNHYVPARLFLLAVLEGLFLAGAAYAGVSFYQANTAVLTTVTSDLLPGQVALLFALGMIILLASMGLYHPEQWVNKRYLLLRLAGSFFVALGLAHVFTLTLYMPLPETSVIAATVGLALVGGVALRMAIIGLSNARTFRSRILVLGTGSRALTIEEHARHSPQHEVVGYISLTQAASYVPSARVLRLEEGDSLASVVQKLAIDKIVVAVRDRRGGGLPVQQLLDCRARGVKVMEIASFFEREYRQVLLESLNMSWMVLGDGFRKDAVTNFVKRSCDLTASLMLLFLTWPVMLITAVCIYLENGAPILFRQERVGKDGRIFNLFKFRSMRNDAESDGKPQWARKDDDRVTKIGRFIRKVRIDELPQIFNVIRGEMSFVGPRPERPFFVDQLSKQIPYYGLRHSAKPGITGWAQVRYPYGATVDDAVEKLQYDLYYLKNHSLFLDLMVLIATVEVVLWGKGAH